MSADVQFIIEIQWARKSPDSPILPRLVGPFDSREEADEWGELNIPNGSWNVSPLAYPYFRTGAS